MAESAETPTDDPGQAPARPSRVGRVLQRVTPRGSTLYVVGVLVLVSIALIFVASIAYGILASRKTYLEQHNLRELDRIAAELNTTRQGLAQTATLHFVPQQLNFSLSSQLECLIATTEIMGARQQPITITYYFTDPTGSGQALRDWYAAQARTQPAAPPVSAPAPATPELAESATTPEPTATAAAQPATSRQLPTDLCGYRRPLSEGYGPETVTFGGNNRLQLARTAPLRNLLWSMASWPRALAAPDASSCTEAGVHPRTVPFESLQAYIRACLIAAAGEDLHDHTAAAGHSYTYRPASQIDEIITQSIDAAFQSNTVRINVSTPTAALDFDSALEIFDAVQIIGTDATNQPVVLHQAGRVPAAIQGDETDEAGMISTITGLAIPGSAGAGHQTARAARQGDFLAESRIIRTGDLILFERAERSLAGLSCPCRIRGIVERGKFDQSVRKIDGSQATIFLIAVLTLIGLIPLLQMKLRKRLDATGRAGQYFVWFALTLLAASASVSGLAIWAATASRNAGAAYAHDEVKQIGDNFRRELEQSLRLVSVLGRHLQPNDVVFPSPRTFPRAETLNNDGTFWTGADKGGGFISGPPLTSVEHILKFGWLHLKQAAIIDSVSMYRGDGFVDRDSSRVAASRFPAYGVSIGDQPYFNRARNRGFNRITATGCQFIVDRVLARADGAPRVAFLLPRDGCGTAQAATSFFSDLRPFYDPTRREFLAAAGTLRTFLALSLRPGFQYAVIDPQRPQDEANVLFHSRGDAELVERFQRELDDPDRFDTLVSQARTDPGTPRQAASADQAETPWQPTEFRMDTNYRAAPSRLTVARLHENMDWILVIVEDRNDAAFSIWRAATFGYSIWFICVVILGLALIIGHGRMSHAVDRRPGLSLWPRHRLNQFTPPLTQRHAGMQRMVAAGAIKRDRHLLWTLVACLIGLPAAEGGSRVLFAMAAATVALAARAYFRGVTTTDAPTARRSDHRVAIFALAMLGAAGIAFFFAMGMDFDLRRFVAARQQSTIDWSVELRALAFLLASALLMKCLLAAHAQTLDTPPALPRDAGPGRRILFRLQSWRPQMRRFKWPRPAPMNVRQLRHRLRYCFTGRPRADIGWILAVIVMGGVPAAAGFLDSYDQDRYLVFDRTEQVAERGLADRREAIASVDRARLLKLPRPVVDQVIAAPAAAAADAPPRPDTRRCVTLSCLAMLYLDLREQALVYSDFASYRMGDAFVGARGAWRVVSVLLQLLVPLALLVLVLLFFRREFFRPAPFLSPGKDPNFDPPLSLTRDGLIRRALLPAARGRPPSLPFRPARGNCHLILGVGLDLRDDWTDASKKTRLGAVRNIQWIDLLDPPTPLTIDRKVVVIGNLDLALQVCDEARVQRTFDIISEIAGSADKPLPPGRHVFLLADIDPLDRISLLWERQGRENSASCVEDWRWAALIQDFTLYPIRHGPPLAEHARENKVLRTIREELGMLDTAFARELCDGLHKQMEKHEARGAGQESDAEADRMVSFITEQMSDHYYKLWASSSDEERVMLYRVAGGCHLKMNDSRGLRSLLTRGLLVRTPEYRLINRSFTRYVRRVGATSDIAGRARNVGGVDRVWPLIRYPLAAAAGAAVLLLQFVAPSAAGGAVGALPALAALLPTLIGKWFQGRAEAS